MKKIIWFRFINEEWINGKEIMMKNMKSSNLRYYKNYPIAKINKLSDDQIVPKCPWHSS